MRHAPKMRRHVLGPIDRIVDSYSRFRQMQGPPLDPLEVLQLVQILNQIPELRSYDPMPVRGHKTSGPFYHLTTSLLENYRAPIDETLLGRIYRAAIESQLDREGQAQGNIIRQNPIRLHFTDDPRWKSNDPNVLRPLYEQSLELDRKLLNRPREQQARFLLSDRLYSGQNDQLVAELQQYSIDWRDVLHGVAREYRKQNVPISEIAEETLRRLPEEVARVRDLAVGPASREVREANDRFDLGEGRLSPECAFWTYEELEARARWALRSLSAEVAFSWLTAHAAPLGMEVRGDLLTADLSSLAEAVTVLIRIAPKRLLCELLTLANLKPTEVWGRESFRWHNVDLVPSYLPSHLVAQLQNELPVDQEVVVLELHYTGNVTPPDTSPLATAVAQQLWSQQLSRFSSDGAITVRRLSLAPGAARTFEVGSGLAVLGLSGQTLTTPVSTTQRLVRRGTVTVREERKDRVLLQPVRILIESSDSLRLFVEEDDDEVYDHLILRAFEVDSSVVVWSLRLEDE